ncbi:MAG TPA: hypothetical protein VKB50_06455 [Vicinamibacterales bacterium]|nr:hypothetical protein [Vicinamibacterales bacterium]
MVSRGVLIVGLMLLPLPLAAQSRICQIEQGRESDENARALLFSRHQCRASTIDLFRRLYNFNERHWDQGWGWDRCSANDSGFAFPRMVDAIYLIRNGIDQPNFGGWHDSVNYARVPTGQGRDASRRHSYRHEPQFTDKEMSNKAMTSHRGLLTTDRVEIKCDGFDMSPADIARALLHEAEHIINGSWHGTLHHRRSSRLCPDKECADRWHDHPVTDPSAPYAIRSTHSMYQIEAEFSCDISTFHADWVTWDVIEVAASTANSILTSNILNPPGWRCARPRPMHWPDGITLGDTGPTRPVSAR